jgi:hypothetical protein
MATNLNITGFHPFNNFGGTSVQCVRRRVASNNSTAIFRGDCIDHTAAGVVGLATAGSGLIGTSTGASYWDATINGRRENPYLPASTTYSSTAFDDYGNTDESFIYVTADPVNTRFRVQYSTGNPALTDLTKNANFVAGSGGSTTTGISSHTLDQTTIATTANKDFRILELWQNVLNDPTAANADVIVQIDLGKVPPFNSAGTAGV